MSNAPPRVGLTLGFVLCGLGATTGVSASVAQAPPTFGSSVEAVYVDAFVTRDGEPVLGLPASAFELRVGGAQQAVELVAVESLPLTALLVFDTSASVVGAKLTALRRASEAFLDGLRPEDELGLLSFSHEVRWQARPTRDRDAVRRALLACQASGGTALWDGLHAGLVLLPTRARSLVVVFTDGEDNMSWLEEAQVRAAARVSNAVIHVVGLRSGTEVDPAFFAKHGRGVEPDHVRAVRATAEVTGGRFWTAESPARLRAAFAAIVAAMNTRYVLRFEPSARSGPGWHPIQLRLRGVKGEVRARGGYFRGPIPSSSR